MLEQLSNFRDSIPSLRAFRNLPPNARREMRNGLLFLSPWIFGFMVFTFIPIIASLFFSFIDLSITDGILSTPKFVGFDNYIKMINDPMVGVNPRTWITFFAPSSTPSAMGVTITFGLMALPVGIFLPLSLALLMNSPYLKGQMVFRSLFYMPYIVPFVAAIYLWGGMLNTESA